MKLLQPEAQSYIEELKICFFSLNFVSVIVDFSHIF